MNWDQLKTILWLRWRLTANQWERSKGLGAVISGIIAFAVVMLGGVAFLGGLLGGIYGLGHASKTAVWGVWSIVTAAFLFFWLVGLMAELQRSETIDLQRLMHLPVVLGQIFIINYLVSHLAVSIVIAVPAMLGLILGLAISRGPAMLLLAPLAMGVVFMITAWTYCLRGWLAALMSNPRRRRTVTVVIMFAFILLGQGPNLYFNVIRRGYYHPAPGAKSAQTESNRGVQITATTKELDRIRAAQIYVPPFWLPLGAESLAEGRPLPALCGALGCMTIGALGLRRAYRATLRFYRGDSGGKIAAQSWRCEKPTATPGQVPVHAGRRFLELQIPGVPEQAAAMALATLRSLLRAPEVKLAWGTSFIVTIILAGTFLFRGTPKIPEAAKPFMATGAGVFSVFMLVQFYTNQFGLDRDGFRAFILSPVERKFILLGKNLACLPVGLGFGLVLVGLTTVRLNVSPLDMLASLVQLAALLMMAGLVGNTLSILAPYRIQPGTLKPTKMPGLAMLVLMACHIFFPIAMAPLFLPPLAQFLWQSAGWSKLAPVNLIFSLALTGVIAVAYWQLLDPLGRLLQRREIKILGIVTVEVE